MVWLRESTDDVELLVSAQRLRPRPFKPFETALPPLVKAMLGLGLTLALMAAPSSEALALSDTQQLVV
ncbi:MAG: hypothetical protein WD136_08985, partial [Cyanobium sp.]